MKKEQTLGESRVRVTFNPCNKDLVYWIKHAAAHLIDICEDCKQDVVAGSAGHHATQAQRNEAVRLWNIAQTEIETAAMYCVKAATSPLAGCPPNKDTDKNFERSEK